MATTESEAELTARIATLEERLRSSGTDGVEMVLERAR